MKYARTFYNQYLSTCEVKTGPDTRSYSGLYVLGFRGNHRESEWMSAWMSEW